MFNAPKAVAFGISLVTKEVVMVRRLYHFGIIVISLMLALFVFAGCTPAPGVRIEGKATGGGSLAKEPAGIAHFGFEGDSCSGTPKGKFNYIDKSTTNVVMANGNITSIVQCIDVNGCFDAALGACPTGAYIIGLDYKSTNPKNPGTGTGGACLIDAGEGTNFPADEGAIGFQTGPYAGYSAQGTVNGNVQGHLCK